MNAQVIQFPTAPARPMLQPSIHGRGVRGYRFHGRVDDWHAPGVQVTKIDSRCAADAAWLVANVMGAPYKKPDTFPGLPLVAERALEYAKMAGLRDYQGEGAAFLACRDYAILADEMGLGKGPEAIIAAEARLSFGAIPRAATPVVLVLCPALAKRHWQREIKKWAGADAAILDGRRPEEIPPARYIIANYDILFGDRRADALGVMHDSKETPGWGKTLANQFLIVINDEAHILRGRSSQRGVAVRNLCAKTPVVWGLTGTPMPNFVRDLWALLDIITGGLAGKYWPWAMAYCGAVSGPYGMDDKGASRTDELGRRLSFFLMMRTKASVGLQLPPFQREVYKVDVELTAPTRYEGRKALDKGNAVAAAFRHTARAKRPAVIEQAVDALNARQKVVVFLYMREQCDAVGKAIHDKVDNATVLIVHGDMSPEGRDKMATTFRDASAPCCFVATIDSVGVAISLVGADLVIFGDLIAEPWKLLQAEKRCHRFDSKNAVMVRYLIAAGTIDEGHAETVVEKLAVLESTMGQQEGNADLATMLGGKSNEEIVDGLFAKLQSLGGRGEG
jgi:SWI/SNF-related matrix-associated actin-dependent regulator 1 of chromatin subfamily A